MLITKILDIKCKVVFNNKLEIKELELIWNKINIQWIYLAQPAWIAAFKTSMIKDIPNIKTWTKAVRAIKLICTDISNSIIWMVFQIIYNNQIIIKSFNQFITLITTIISNSNQMNKLKLNTPHNKLDLINK